MMNRQQLMLVQTKHLDRVWTYLEPMLIESPELWNKFFKLNDIAEWLKQERLHLWMSNNTTEFTGAVLCCFVDYPQSRALCLIWSNIQELSEVLPFLDEIERWGQLNGAREVIVYGRRGWLPKLKDRGYHEDYLAISKNLPHMKEC